MLSSALAEREGWETYHDKKLGFKLPHPAGPDWTCGLGAYGLGYDEQFGCKGDPFKLLILPWTANTEGRFDVNIQTGFVRGSGEEILEMIAESMEHHGYKSLGRMREGAVTMRGFANADTRREVWYVLHGELLLEINTRFGKKYAEGKPHAEAKGLLREIVTSVEFAEVVE